MTNALDIFKTTMAIMDELDENGEADILDNKEYKDKTLAILNMLRGELYRFSDTFRQTEDRKRPIADMISNFSDPIGLDDYICQTVLPNGLAAHLLIGEDPSKANFFQQRYEELLREAMNGFPAESEDIVDVYSHGDGLGFAWTTRW